MKKLSKLVLSKFNKYSTNNTFGRRDLSIPITLTVKNPTKKTIQVILFGAVDDNTKSHKYITVDFGVTYQSILKSLLSKWLYVDRIRVQSSNVNALLNTATLLSKNIFGQSLSDPYNIFSYMTATQRNQNLIECDKSCIISENVSFLVNVPAKTSISYSFYDSQYCKFKYNINQKTRRSPFSKLVLDMLKKADFVLEQFNKNPYLHYNDGMDSYCLNIQREIHNWIIDNGFDLAFHKNMINIYDILQPFIEKYYKICQDAEPFLFKYEQQKRKEEDEFILKNKSKPVALNKKAVKKMKTESKKTKSKSPVKIVKLKK